MTTTNSKRITPYFGTFETECRWMLENAERSNDFNTAAACYAVAWFFGTGRAFTGAHRVVSHMTKSTVKAFLRRTVSLMATAASKRGSTCCVSGDMNNVLLAAALGLPVDRADVAACDHEYGVRYTLG